MNSERFVGESKLHEMVAIAMEESWDVCVAHMLMITRVIGEVIAQGAASGEFRGFRPPDRLDVRLHRDDALLPPRR